MSLMSHVLEGILVDGYIHTTNNEMYNVIIPTELNGICLSYYYGNFPSIETLIEARKHTEDLNTIFGIEKLVLTLICSMKFKLINLYDYKNKNTDSLKDILKHWSAQDKTNTFRRNILKGMEQCIQNDNANLLRIFTMFKFCGYNIGCGYTELIYSERYNEIVDFIVYCPRYNAFGCLYLLFRNPKNFIRSTTISDNHRVSKISNALLNAVTYHPTNIDMINYIIDGLEELEITFVCSDIMKQIIRNDLVSIAKRIVRNKWHQITKQDEDIAKLEDNECNKYFEARRYVQCLNKDDICNGFQLNLDDDGWDDNDTFEYFVDDDTQLDKLKDDLDKQKERIQVLQKQNNKLLKEVRFLTEIQIKNNDRINDLQHQNARLSNEIQKQAQAKAKFTQYIENANKTIDELRQYLIKCQNCIQQAASLK